MTITYSVNRSLYVNLTNRCPCSCVFCIRNNADGVYESGPLWLEREPTAQEVFDSILARDAGEFDELVFCGYGEPTERLDCLLDVARRVREARPNLKIRLNTNGLSDLINSRPTAGELKGLVDTVSVSLNTPDASEYVRLCRPKFGASSWQAMIDFARACVASVPDVVLSIVGEPVTSREKEEECRIIANSVGATLRVRKYEGALPK